MSTEILTYVPSVDDSLSAKWIASMARLGMECEIHPEVSLVSHSGVLPFKLRIQDSAHQELNGNTFLTGFEYYLEDFNLESERARMAKAGGLKRLFRRARAEEPYASVELDQKLGRCHKLLTFSFGSADLFETRMATVSSGLIGELLGGVSCSPTDGVWAEGAGMAEKALAEARAYENALDTRTIVVRPFEERL